MMEKNLSVRHLFLLLLFTAAVLLGHVLPSHAQTYPQWGMPFAGVPERQNAVIYQVNIRSFSQQGNFSGVQARLDEIRALGVNVLYLMPIYPVGQERSAGGLGSPYAVRDYKAVNPEFGSLADLRALVDAAHSRGMAVMLDWVANHTAWDHAWISQHKDWYQQDASGNIIIPPGTNWQDVAQLNFNNQQMRAAMIDAMRYWVYTANIDGFRYDAADFVPFDFWQQAISSLRTISNHKLLLLAEGARNDHYRAGFDYIFGMNFFYGISTDIFHNNAPATRLNDANVVEYGTAVEGSQRAVRYISNHDVNAYEGTPQELFGSKRAAQTAFIVAALMKGVPMIYNGQEIGYPHRLQFFTRTPIDWSLADTDWLAWYKRVIAFYHSSNAIRRGNLTLYNSADVSAFTREYNGERVLVLANLRNYTVNYALPAAVANSSWQGVFSGMSHNLSNQVTLGPYEHRVLRPNNSNAVAIPGTIQAENWTAQQGVQTENTTDTGGGQNVGWIEAGDWMDYNVNVAKTATYTVSFRVASAPGGGAFELRRGSTVLASRTVAATGGWQNWTTITAQVNLQAGAQTLRLHATAPGFNLNWISFSENTSTGTTRYRIRNRWQNSYLYDAGDRALYATTPSGAAYEWILEDVGGGHVEIRNAGTGEYLHIENLTGYVQATARTFGWYSSRWSREDAGDGFIRIRNAWQTTHLMHVENLQGHAQHGILDNAWWSGHWMLEPVSAGARTAANTAAAAARGVLSLQVFPNPLQGQDLRVAFKDLAGEKAQLRILDINGKVVYRQQVTGSEVQIPATTFSSGLYIIRLQSGQGVQTRKFVVK